jgi:ADP-ribosylglycohydrolase
LHADEAGRNGVEVIRVVPAALGFAAGDAYGHAVERALVPFSSPDAGRVTDATQVFAASTEGLLRAMVRFANGKQPSPPEMVWHGISRWADGSGFPLGDDARGCAKAPAWLAEQQLMGRRAFHGTAMKRAVLNGRGENASAGAGVLAHVAPLGLIRSFDIAIAREVAALTHHEPSAMAAAEALHGITRRMIDHGDDLARAALQTSSQLYAGAHAEQARLAKHIERAVARIGGSSIPQNVPAHLATGALVIAVQAAGSSSDLSAALDAATAGRGQDAAHLGAVTGFLSALALTGASADLDSPIDLASHSSGTHLLPTGWRSNLDGLEVIERMAADLVRLFGPSGRPDVDAQLRYPGR